MKSVCTSILLTFILLYSCAQKPTIENNNESEQEKDSLFLAGFNTNRQWPSFRGYYACGYLDSVNLPESWNIQTGENILWRTQIPGLGLSSPVIWDNRVYITTAVGKNDSDGIKTGIFGEGEPVSDESIHEWKVLCIDKSDGKIIWEKTACQGVPEVKRHPKSSHANPTIATNGRFVVAFFGSEGLYCYDSTGQLIWEKDFGYLLSAPRGYEAGEWEFASSPIINRNGVIIQCDVNNVQFLTALSIETGETIWKVDRVEDPGWCTPNIYSCRGREIVAVNGYRQRGGYDLETGELIWSMSGGGDVPIPTPILYKNLIFFNSAHGRYSPILAIKKNAEGKIDFPDSNKSEYIAWFIDRGGAYMQTMLVYDDLLYNMRWNGSLSCYNPETGEMYYRTTVDPGSFVASPVAADGKIYLISEEGTVYTIKAGKNYELTGKSELGEITLSTPAISDSIIVFRTVNTLLGISGNSVPDP